MEEAFSLLQLFLAGTTTNPLVDVGPHQQDLGDLVQQALLASQCESIRQDGLSLGNATEVGQHACSDEPNTSAKLDHLIASRERGLIEHC